jgi:hypothetical protein
MKPLGRAAGIATLVAGLALAATAQASGVVYRCPGPPVLYTDQLSAAEAQARGCRTIDGAPVTVLHAAPRPRPPVPAATAPGAAPQAAARPGAPGAAGPPTAAARPEGSRIDTGEQRRRDIERRAILEAELRREEQRMAELRREFNDGQPERRGDERNYARYLERVANLRAAIERSESDIAALRREIERLPD